MEADVTTQRHWTKNSLSTNPSTEKAMQDRREMIEIANECRSRNQHKEYISGSCTQCGTPAHPENRCVKHGPYLSGKCINCGERHTGPLEEL